MITTKAALQQFEETATHYINELDQFNMKQLNEKQADNEWSIGQMIQHLISSALDMQLYNAEQCLLSSEKSLSSRMEKTELGAAIFAQGSFPPIRIQVPPSAQYTPQQPESKEQLVQGLHMVIQKMKGVEPLLEKASRENTMPHPAFGELCAEEWFLLVEMHYRHHLLQLESLKQGLAGEAT